MLHTWNNPPRMGNTIIKVLKQHQLDNRQDPSSLAPPTK